MFNTGYTEILKDQDAFITIYTSIMPSQEDMAYKLVEWYVDNKATTTADVSTGKCLVYEDMNFYIVRASIDFRVMGKDNATTSFTDMYGINLNNGAGTAICETYFYKDGSGNIVGFTLTNAMED